MKLSELLKKGHPLSLVHPELGRAEWKMTDDGSMVLEWTLSGAPVSFTDISGQALLDDRWEPTLKGATQDAVVNCLRMRGVPTHPVDLIDDFVEGATDVKAWRLRQVIYEACGREIREAIMFLLARGVVGMVDQDGRLAVVSKAPKGEYANKE